MSALRHILPPAIRRWPSLWSRRWYPFRLFVSFPMRFFWVAARQALQAVENWFWNQTGLGKHRYWKVNYTYSIHIWGLKDVVSCRVRCAAMRSRPLASQGTFVRLRSGSPDQVTVESVDPKDQFNGVDQRHGGKTMSCLPSPSHHHK